MEFEVKAPIDIPDGNHSGQITKIVYRMPPEHQYEYTDIFVSVNGQEGVELKYGCPSNLSPSSKLGRLLVNFDVALVPGEKIDPEKVLVGKLCTFMALKKAKDGKEFTEIVEDSLKPIEAQRPVMPAV